VLLALAGVAPAAAQRWQPASSATRFAWGTVNVLVLADSTTGTRLWAFTSSLGYDGRPLQFVGSFDPDRLSPWLDLAYAVVARTPPAVPDSIPALQSPPVTSTDGSQLVVLRGRDKGRWAKRARILLIGPTGRHPWSIDASLDEADAFLKALYHQAFESRLQPDSTAVPEANPMAGGTCPWPLPGNPALVYPYRSQRMGQAGEVWMSFVVQADGTVDGESFRALLFDDPAFADAAYDALKDFRFQPGTLHGQPTAMRVFQRVSFKTR
jgi:TonB family protein